KKALGGFIVCTFVIACGLASLETAANSYAAVIGDPKTASMRLQFCQAWNGVASFIGPLIASKFFFSGSDANGLTNVQYVYLAVAIVAVLVGILFFFAKMPEFPAEDMVQLTGGNETKIKPLWKQYNMIFAFVAQFCYVGAQVTVGSFFINYCVENASYTNSEASNLLSYALIIFTVGRFFGVALAHFLQADLVLLVYGIISVAFSLYISLGHGVSGVAILMALYFFQSLMYPSIFVMGTSNLGPHTRRGAGILVMGVSGGAVFPPIQGTIADKATTRISYLVPMFGYFIVALYASYHWISHGFKVKRDRQSPEVVAIIPPPSDMTEMEKVGKEDIETNSIKSPHLSI
ncbi:unnamed protein product, partial [Adineta ricciae]